MRVQSFSISLLILCSAALISITGCIPKYIVKGEQVKGQIVVAGTGQPVEDAAVAIRWFDEPSNQKGNSGTFRAVQTLSDRNGFFEIPRYPAKSYTLGIYKDGYVCWSSRDIFSTDSGPRSPAEYQKRSGHVVEDGMLIELQPFVKQYSRHQHAGFTVMVAAEASDSSKGPFQQAVEPEYRLWRESLRKDFRKKFSNPHPATRYSYANTRIRPMVAPLSSVVQVSLTEYTF